MNENEANLDLYKFYLTELKTLYEGYVSFEITLSLAILTALGWFLTSEKTQKLLSTQKYVGAAFMSAITLTALSEIYIVYKIKMSSNSIYSIVEMLASKLKPHIKEDYYSYRKMDLDTIVVFYGIHLFLLGLLAFVIRKNSVK